MPGAQSHKNLQGRSFKGQRLSGEDFTGCDIRGADFTNAVLIGVNFSHVKAGQPLIWMVVIVLIALLLTISAGYVLAYAGGVIGSMMVTEKYQPLAFWSSIIALSVLAVLILISFKRGLGVALGAFSLLVAFIVVLVAGLAKVSVTAAAIVQVVAVAGAIAGSMLASVALTILKTAIKNRLALSIFFLVFVLGSLLGGWEGLDWERRQLVQGIPITAFITGALVGFSTYISSQIASQDKKYWLIYKTANFFTALGGTCFRGSDLTDADFTQAILSSTDFRKALLTRTCWFQTKNLEQARVDGTYLEDVRVRQLVITKEGSGEHFEYFDLRGINLKDANLKDTFFIGADLSESTLENAQLIGARLAKAQFYQANLKGTNLTGAYIENWGISTDTNMEAIRCSYIYMRLPTSNDPDPCRKPDNRAENFKDGDFTDFIAPIIKTLDLYQTQNVDLREIASKFRTLDLFHNEGIDPSAAAIALQQLTEQHPEAELEVIALEGRANEKIRLQAKVTRDANRSELYAEYFSRYRKIKSLSYRDLQTLLAGMAEKDERISSLESLLENALKQPKFYVETYHNQGDTMSENTYNFNQAKFGGGFAGTGGTQTGGTFNDYSSNQNLSEAAGEIQKLLKQLELSNPTTTELDKVTVAAKAAEEIKKNPMLKDRAIAALKSGGTEAFKEAVDHPLVNILVAIIEGWMQGE